MHDASSPKETKNKHKTRQNPTRLKKQETSTYSFLVGGVVMETYSFMKKKISIYFFKTNRWS
jgi:hypothetical protein